MIMIIIIAVNMIMIIRQAKVRIPRTRRWPMAGSSPSTPSGDLEAAQRLLLPGPGPLLMLGTTPTLLIYLVLASFESYAV